MLRASLLALTLLAAPLQDERKTSGTTPSRPLRPSTDPAIQTLLADYEIPEKEFPWELRDLRRGDKVAVSWLTFPSALKTGSPENDLVGCRFWCPLDGARRRPAVVLLHWLGGSFETLDIIGHRLAEQGVAALMVYLPGYGPRRPPARRRAPKP